MESGAYGAAKAGGSFNLQRFLSQPQVVVRAVCTVFALIVFACIFGEGYTNIHKSQQRYCVFNHNEDACRYGGAIGVLAFLASAAFFVVDAYFPQISNATDRKYLVIGDLLFSGCASLPGLPALQSWGGRLHPEHPELCGPHSQPQYGLRLLPHLCGQLPATALHPECGDHRGLPAAPCVLSHSGGGKGSREGAPGPFRQSQTSPTRSASSLVPAGEPSAIVGAPKCLVQKGASLLPTHSLLKGIF
ncbi:synaptogyrin-2 isoform 2-T2 [Dugong dugon]